MSTEPEQSPPDVIDDDRRSFFARLSIALSALIAAALTLPVVGFILAPVFSRSKSIWRRVGKVSEFTVGKTVNVQFQDAAPKSWAGVTALTGAWLRRDADEEFIAFSINCRHLGCPVRWVEEATLFMCPCHGGVYYADGEVAAGPPPGPLARYSVRVRDGFVEIETSAVPLTTNDPL